MQRVALHPQANVSADGLQVHLAHRSVDLRIAADGGHADVRAVAIVFHIAADGIDRQPGRGGIHIHIAAGALHADALRLDVFLQGNTHIAAGGLHQDLAEVHIVHVHVTAGSTDLHRNGVFLRQGDGHFTAATILAVHLDAAQHLLDAVHQVGEAVPFLIHALHGLVLLHPHFGLVVPLDLQRAAVGGHNQVGHIFPVVIHMDVLIIRRFEIDIIGGQQNAHPLDLLGREHQILLGLLVVFIILVIGECCALPGILGNDVFHALQAVHHRGNSFVFIHATVDHILIALLAIVHHLVLQGLYLVGHLGILEHNLHNACNRCVHRTSSNN